MSLKSILHRTNLKTKQFTGTNGGNAVVGIPENTEFELVNETFISTNTAVYVEITCRKDPYQDFEAVDNEAKKEYPIQPVKKLRPRTVIRMRPGKAGYEADIYNERNDQAITIMVGPENDQNLDLLLDMIKSAKFI